MIYENSKYNNTPTSNLQIDACSSEYFDALSTGNQSLPSPINQRSDIVAIVLSTTFPMWLNSDYHKKYWLFKSVIVVDFNSLMDSRDLMEYMVLKRARDLVLLKALPAYADGEIAVHLCTPSYFGRRQPDIQTLCRQWDKNNFASYDTIFENRFRDFEGEVLHVASDIDDFPLLIIAENGSRAGISKSIMDAVSSNSNFSYTSTIQSNDELWGDFEDGCWTGLLKDLLDGGKNVTINYFTLTEERANSFDFSVPFLFEGFGFVLPAPTPYPPWRRLFNPFSINVWLGILVTLLIMPVLIHFLAKMSGTSICRTFGQTALAVFKSFIWQGITRQPKGDTERSLYMAWWWWGFFISYSYTSNLVAELTLPDFPPIITSVHELAKSPLRIMMLDYGEFLPDTLRTSDDPDLRTLGVRMDLHPFNESDPRGLYAGMIDALKARTHAITETSSYLRLVVRDSDLSPTDFFFLRDQVYPGSVAFFFPKYSPWKGKFDTDIQSLLEGGFVTKWRDEAMASLGLMGAELEESSVESLSLYHLQGPFVIIFIGWILSFLVVVAEFLGSKLPCKPLTVFT
ncbi:Ionotropic glutamate receptor L-glutamate and glycine-binding domain [Trinorchestia longiramus]|nr:Ionotropic glutamate receptor L-glutamate and glycine-binding domain [Trinorchestia longiramus]